MLIIQIICSPIHYVWADDEIEEVTEEELEEQVVETAAQATELPKQDARVGLVYDRKTKEVIYEKNGYKQVPMASTTKIMTATVVLENCDITQTVEITQKAAGTGGSRLGLKHKDKITVRDLLYGLLLRSGNDAAVALAIHTAGSVEEFAKMMNQKAVELGLQNTHFVTPHGLDATQHYTTAYELAIMADYAMQNETFKNIVGTKTAGITINGQSKTIQNTNELLGYLNGVTGIKTGFTNGAGRCLVTCCNRNGQEIICVVLGADTKKIRTSDSIKLIEYAYKTYTYKEVKTWIEEEFTKWQQMNEQRIWIEKGIEIHPTLVLEEITKEYTTVKQDNTDVLDVKINHVQTLEAPVLQGQKIGVLQVYKNGEIWLTVDIINSQEIRKKEMWDYCKDILSKFQHFEEVYEKL